MSGDSSATYLVAIDVGTTNVRCLIINSSGITVGKAYQKVKSYYFENAFLNAYFQVQIYQPQPGWMEINPDELFTSVLEVMHTAIEGRNVIFIFIFKFLKSKRHTIFAIKWVTVVLGPLEFQFRKFRMLSGFRLGKVVWLVR